MYLALFCFVVYVLPFVFILCCVVLRFLFVYFFIVLCGDSKEQNGSFNMAMTDAKRKLLDLKRKSCMNETIDKNDLMLLINIAWNKSFARVDKNRRAIADRGWGPYNRNILTFSHIRATMTETDRIYDLNYQVVISCTVPVRKDKLGKCSSKYFDEHLINLTYGIIVKNVP